MDEDVEADLAKIDALYPGFPDPADWAALDVDMSAWDDAAGTLAAIREADPELGVILRDRAFREAGVDTGAIEGLYTTDRGFTMTVADAASLEEAARYVRSHKGADVEALFRAQVEGYEMALDLVAQGRPMTESWLRQLHETIVGPQDTYEVFTAVGPQEHALPKGEYKRHPNHVLQPDGTTFAYAPVAIVADEVHRFVEHANGEVVASMHPVVASAWMHYALVRIHPFADGNGRVTRAVASLPLLRAASIPFTVPIDRRDAYLQALRGADARRPTSFVRFAREEITSNLRLLVSTSQRDDDSSVAIVLDGDGPGLERYIAAAKRLEGLAIEAVDAAIAEVGGGQIRTGRHRGDDPPVPRGWVDAGQLDDEIQGFGIRKDAVGVIRVLISVRVLLAEHLGIGSDLLLDARGREPDEVFSIDEIDPTPTRAVRRRLEAWAAGVRNAALRSVAAVTPDGHP